MADKTLPQGTRLRDIPTDDLKKEIVCKYWLRPHTQCDLGKYATYFNHYYETCLALYLGGIQPPADSLAVRSHEDLLQVVETLCVDGIAASNLTRVTLRKILRERYFPGESDQRLNASIALAIGLWLTIDIREPNPKFSYRTMCWNDVSSLKDFVHARFKGPESEQRAKILLGNDITAVNLKKLSGIAIDWTHDLENHLLYDRDRKILKVYRLEHVIQAHKTSGLGIIPEGLIDETIASLHLLFPTWDPRTKIYLRKLDQGHFPETIIDTHRQTYTTDFYYWHDRLAQLSNESQLPPSAPNSTLPALRLLWNDHRNPHQWWTFWLAVAILVLTVVFGFVTSIATCMQPKYAYQSLQLARAAVPSRHQE